MPGNTSHLSPLESRKQLLVTDSELNRAGLSEEWQAMTHGVHDFAHRARSAAAWASSAALLVAGVSALRRDSTRSVTGKFSGIQIVLKGARLASTLWLAFRARGEKHQ